MTVHHPKKFNGEIQWIIQEKYGGKRNPALRKDLERLRKEEPVNYIIGWLPFLDSKIDLSLRPFIPRPETEYWVEEFIESIKSSSAFKQRKTMKVLDIFAGSGCIGIAVLKNLKNTKVDFAEINPRFIKQIKISLKLNGISSSRYRIIQSCILERVREKYDFILANPPYVSLKNKKRIPASVINYEPRSALFGGNDGLFYIRKFLSRAKNYLKPGGAVWMEFDSPQKNEIIKIAFKNGYQSFDAHRDQYGRFRYIVLRSNHFNIGRRASSGTGIRTPIFRFRA